MGDVGVSCKKTPCLAISHKVRLEELDTDSQPTNAITSNDSIAGNGRIMF